MFSSGSNQSRTNIPPLNQRCRYFVGTWTCSVWWLVISVNRVSVTVLPQLVQAPTLWWPPGGRTASMGSATAAAMTRCTERATRSGAPEVPRSCSTTTGSPRRRTFPGAVTCTTESGPHSTTSRWESPEVPEPQPAGKPRSPAYRQLVGRWGGRGMVHREVDGTS